MKKFEIPALYLEEMGRLLGEEYPAFQATYESDPIAGLRVNTLKVESERLRALLPYKLTPLPWSDSGFQLDRNQDSENRPPGRHPYHAAGLYYLQEPSALIAAQALNPSPGERVLDLCAAPGGKATHLAALMNHQGLLAANEIHPRRVWELVENLERWGARNVVITNESPARLANRFTGFFDKIMVDAPCSGEGMFRKSEAARREWSPGLTVSCAIRQTAILESAIQMLKPGGRLAYSTCTFNPLENESVISGLLDQFPQLELVEIPSLSTCSPGRPEWVSKKPLRPALSAARRVWPHLSPGEGHFVVLLQLKDSHQDLRSRQPAAQVPAKPWGTAPALQILKTWTDFCWANFYGEGIHHLVEENRLGLVGTYLYQFPHDLPDLSGLKVIHPGWWLGTVHSGIQKEIRFEPAHAFAMGLDEVLVNRRLNLQADSPQVDAYLRGEVLESSEGNGWILVEVDGFPLGWGKIVGGRVKNAYPRGLRWV